MSQRQTPKNQPPLTHTTTHDTQHTTQNRKHRHHGSPKLPASSSSNITGECNRCTSCNLSGSSQHGNVLLFDSTNIFLHLFYYYSMCSGSACLLTKGEFLEWLIVLYHGRCIKTMHTDPSYSSIFFLSMSLESLSCFGMILDKGGWGAIIAMLLYGRGRLRVVVSVVY